MSPQNPGFGPACLPDEGLPRSVCAARAVEHARGSGLFFAHFEHGVHLETEAWAVERADLGELGAWKSGVLPESKFRHFRLDRMVGSFHPAHSPKWTAHELCHRLVGWAWRPGADALFLANAARLAELLPVALWYFYDEPARRCERHTWVDARFDQRCAACEARVAQEGPLNAAAIEAGDRFVADELAAFHAGVRDGIPRAHRWATLDLCSDGLAWAAAHGPRLRSREFAAWVERFVPETSGRSPSLEALEARLLAVCAALRDDAPLTPWTEKGAPVRWEVADVAWRLTAIQADSDAGTADRIDRMLDDLATTGDLGAAVTAWRGLAEEVEVPSVEEAFAVGYTLVAGRSPEPEARGLPFGQPLGRSTRQITEGLASVCPRTLAWIDPASIARFVADDRAVRMPLGRRFASWLARDTEPGRTRGGSTPSAGDAPELAALEAAIVHAPPMDSAVATFRGEPDPGGPVYRAPGVEILPVTRAWIPWLTANKRPKLQSGWIAVVREPDGQVALWEVEGAAVIGTEPCTPAVSAHVRRGLLEAGVWAAVR